MNKTSFKIAIAISIVTIMLLIFVDIITVNQVQRAFNEFIQAQEIYGYRMTLDLPALQANLHLENQFRASLYKAIAFVSVLAFFASLILGIFIANFLTKPLRELRKGIENLRASDYTHKIDFTGDDELDIVIDEFNKFSSELEHQEKLRSDLIADISHEFKTPLTALVGQIEGIKDGIFELDDSRLDKINSQVNRLNSLIENLQQYTILRSNINRLQKKNIKLNDVFIEVKKFFADDLEKNNIKLITQLPSAKFSIKADKAMLIQIFDNLFSNTIRYSHAKKITIVGTKNEIKYCDDGIGIQKEHLKYIFERFYRVEKSRNRKTGGLGLGLAIVKEIVEAHGWKIEIIEVKKGVCFVIKF